MATIKKLDYKKATADDIKEFLVSKKISDEEKKEFYAYTHITKTEKIAQPVFDKDGKPVMYQVKTKDKQPKFNKDGKPVMRQKLKMVEKLDGEKNIIFDFFKAKEWVLDRFPDDIENKPKSKEKKEKKDPFGDWQ